MSHWLCAGKIGEAWAFTFLRRGPIALNTLVLRGRRDRFDLDNTVCLGLDITSKESVPKAEKVVNKLAKGHLHVLVNNPHIHYTMTALDTDFKMVAAVFVVNVYSPPYMLTSCTLC